VVIMDIDENLILDIKDYLLAKTGVSYFNHIKATPKDIMVSCPFHKGGQESNPSCGIKRFSDEYGSAGQVHCFTCGEKTTIVGMIRKVLGNLYDWVEVENTFHFGRLYDTQFTSEQQKPLFELPNEVEYVRDNLLERFRGVYHSYLFNRGISEETALKFDIGYDSVNKHITFPIRDIYGKCLGVGRRTILGKQYIYPQGFTKPLYGVYELSFPLNYLWIVEGPFNLWSLNQWGKNAVALLGTGTAHQYEQLKDIKTDGYVLALDPDNAGRLGTMKLINYISGLKNTNIYVCDIPEGKDINDLNQDQFKCCDCLYYTEWKNKYKINL